MKYELFDNSRNLSMLDYTKTKTPMRKQTARYRIGDLETSIRPCGMMGE